MPRAQITTPEALPDERSADAALRPSRLDEFVGQAKVKESLQIAIDAAKQRREPLDHALFFGPPGLGKTTLALLMAKELGVNIRTTSGPVLERPGDLVGMLTSLEAGDILFIDEVPRRPAHAAGRQPPAEARARLRPGPRRRQDHGARGARGAEAARRGRVRTGRHGRPHPEDDHRAVRGRPRGTADDRRRRGRGLGDARGGVRAVPDAAGLPRPHPARPRRYGSRVQAFWLHSAPER